MSKHILIAGGTGLIGTALQKEAEKQGYQFTLLSRAPGPNIIVWQPDKRNIQLSQKMHFDAIINLVGSSMSEGRWTQERKEEIYSSRINSAKTLHNYLFDGRLSTDVYVGVSGVAYYGDAGDDVVVETSPHGDPNDWLVKTVLDWENEHQQIAELEIRTIILRTSVILSEKGGALKEILDKSKLGALPVFGSGKQYFPWIHIEDYASLVFYLMHHETAEGIYLAVAPEAITNKDFIKAIQKTFVNKPIVPVPRFALSIILGEMHRVVFDSCRAKSVRIDPTGFKFQFSEIQKALQNLATKD